MTNHWVDIKNADIVLIMGGNAAEAHPCGFKWVTEAKAHNKAKLIVVDPRFTRSAAMADYYSPIRVGTDIAFLGGLINYLVSNDKIQKTYVKSYTNASFVLNEKYAFADGLFSGYSEAKRSYDPATWGYEKDKTGYAVVDETLQNPRIGRRHERPARPQQHPGAHGLGPALQRAAGLFRPAQAEGAILRRLCEDAIAQTAAAEPDELLAELPQVLCKPHEGLVRQCGNQGQPLGVRVSAEARQGIRRPASVRVDGPGQDQRLYLPGLQPV